jgi:CYTH domain-containing protein
MEKQKLVGTVVEAAGNGRIKGTLKDRVMMAISAFFAGMSSTTDNELQEIERRFLLNEVPLFETLEHKHIRQGYLLKAKDGSKLRLRQIGDAYIFSIKRGKGLVRMEVEFEIEQADFDALWPLTVGKRIEKTRYYLPLENGHIAELDRFHGDLYGHLQVEVEFASASKAERFTPPAWFGREVTEDGRYTNSSLAKRGLPA